MYTYYSDYKSINVKSKLKIEECVMGLYVGIIMESQAHKTWLFYCLVCSAYVINIFGHRLLLNRASLPWQRI